MTHDLPAEWTLPRLQTVARVSGGKRLPKGERLVDDNTGYPYIRVTDMTAVGIDTSGIRYVPGHVAPVIDRYRAYSGDLYISVAGTLGLIGKIPQELDGANLTENADRISQITCDPDFLLYVLRSEVATAQLASAATMNAQPKLALQRIRQLRIPLPPLPEQRRIAEILGTWDEAIALVERRIDAARRRKQGLMQRLLTGRVRFPGFQGAWKEVRLGEVVRRKTAQFQPANGGSIPCVELEHIAQRDGRLLGSVPSRQQASTKTLFEPGDVLFGKLRPYLRKYARPDFSGCCSSEIWVLSARPRTGSDAFLYYLVQGDRFSAVASVSSGSKMPRSDWKLVQASRFPWPSLEEQEAIATALGTCDDEIDLLARKLTALQRQKKGLMQRLLTGRVRV